MDFDTFFADVDNAASFLRKKKIMAPRVVVVLTGGLGGFVDKLDNKISFASLEIPHFPKTTVRGHAGKIIFGTIKGAPLVVLQGRYHYYEGCSPQAVVFPYFVFQKLGAKIVVSTNSAGGINKTFKSGDIMLIEDHINFTGGNPLMGLSSKTNQFVGMGNAYDAALRDRAIRIAKQKKMTLKKGVYLGTMGPSYETPAEIKAMRILGADAVGMSTVMEVIACNFLKMKVLALSLITNEAADIHKGEISHKEVLDTVAVIKPKLIQILVSLVEDIL